MSPGFNLRQAAALIALLIRKPILSTRAHLALINRGLCYLAQNPDLAWWQYFLDLEGSGPSMDTLVLIADKGLPVFSLVLAQGLIGNLPGETLRSFRDLDSFREKIEADLDRPLQAVLIDAAIIERINSRLVREKSTDPFFVAGREILASLSEGMIRFSPIMPEAEMLASLDGEELLCKFGPRYGLSMENPARFVGVIRGLRLVLLSPVTRWRMKKNFLYLND
jgi:hypothetical protein